MAVIVVVALATALGIGLASAPAEPAGAASTVEAAATRAFGAPAEAAFERLDMGVDAFTDLERRLAEERRRRAQDLLDRVYPDRAYVEVAVELDPRWERTTEKVQPEWPAVVEDERPEGGATGSRRRLLEPFAGTREMGLLAPELRRVSVALVLDESIARNRTQRDAIVAAVTKAVGPVRGRDPDVEVLVERFPFDSPPLPVVGQQKAADETLLVGVGVAGWAALVALSALVFVFTRIRRARIAAATAPEAPPPVDESAELRRSVEQAIEEDPNVVTRLVEGWLAESRS